MSVAENNVVDGMGIAQDGKTLIMLITDHLDWEENFEFDHLMMLQDKINSYVGFIESKQYADIYPNNDFNKYSIEVHFLHALSDNCNKFINTANRQLSSANIEIVPSLPENKNDNIK